MASHLRIADGPVENHRRAILDADHLKHRGPGFPRVESREIGRCGGLQRGEADDLLLLGGACPLPLLLHEGLEARVIDGEPALAGEEFGQVERESLLVVEPERHLAGDALPLGCLLLEEGESLVEGLVEGLLLPLERFGDERLPGAHFGKGITHDGGEHRGEFVKERRGEAECASVADGASQDAAQHVVAFGIAGLDAVGDGEAEGAQVVGDDAEGDIILFLIRDGNHRAATGGLRKGRAVLAAADGPDRLEDGAEEIGLVVGDHHVAEFLESIRSLHHRADALESHPGVDMAGGEGDEGTVGIRVKLDEDKVPDLDALGAPLVDEGALRVPVRGQVDVEFGAGAAGASLAHHPEIVLPVAGDDMDRGIESLRAEELRPERVGLGVEGGGIPLRGAVDSRVKAFGGKFPLLDKEFPSPADRLFLEVISEGPVAQHLEEGVVVGIQSHILEVVVLAARADALLRVGGAGRSVGAGGRAEEDRHELVHPGIGEEEVR